QNYGPLYHPPKLCQETRDYARSAGSTPVCYIFRHMSHAGIASLLAAIAPLLAPSPSPAQAPPSVSKVAVDPSRRYQTIEGFGVNYTGPYFRDDQKRMFDFLIDDLGVSMFRVVAYFVYSDWEVVNDNADPLSAN